MLAYLRDALLIARCLGVEPVRVVGRQFVLAPMVRAALFVRRAWFVGRRAPVPRDEFVHLFLATPAGATVVSPALVFAVVASVPFAARAGRGDRLAPTVGVGVPAVPAVTGGRAKRDEYGDADRPATDDGVDEAEGDSHHNQDGDDAPLRERLARLGHGHGVTFRKNRHAPQMNAATPKTNSGKMIHIANFACEQRSG